MVIDVLIIGSGGAGLSAAIEASKNGVSNITVLSKSTITSSQTTQAQGGINAVLNNPLDSIQNHIDDTLKSAHSIGDKENITFMCENAIKSVNWLDELAVPFSKDKNMNIAQRKLGGTSNPRACYSSDYTGLKILHTLYDTAIKNGINFLEDYMLLNIIKEHNIAIGVSVLNIQTGEVEQILAHNTILATGGYAGIYTNHTTNSYGTTGDGIVVAYNAGCLISNMEFVQFHPTALKNNCILISESARGEGGYLVTKNGERFIDELLPRDIVARAIYEKIQNNIDIFLDLRHLGYDKIIETMPQEYKIASEFLSLKMERDLIPIKPVAHYSMGGISTSKDGKTSIKGLYAVGECSNNGVHGANRLGGNSLLEIITFGREVGRAIAHNTHKHTIQVKNYPQYIDDKQMIENIFSKDDTMNFYKIKNTLGKDLYHLVGLFRDKANLKEMLAKIKVWEEDIAKSGINDKNKLFNTNLKEYLELKNILLLSNMVTTSALHREESRGAHYRIDFSAENKKYQTNSIIQKDTDEVIFND